MMAGLPDAQAMKDRQLLREQRDDAVAQVEQLTSQLGAREVQLQEAEASERNARQAVELLETEVERLRAERDDARLVSVAMAMGGNSPDDALVQALKERDHHRETLRLIAKSGLCHVPEPPAFSAATRREPQMTRFGARLRDREPWLFEKGEGDDLE
jgi:hypothetical protein